MSAIGRAASRLPMSCGATSMSLRDAVPPHGCSRRGSAPAGGSWPIAPGGNPRLFGVIDKIVAIRIEDFENVFIDDRAELLFAAADGFARTGENLRLESRS